MPMHWVQIAVWLLAGLSILSFCLVLLANKVSKEQERRVLEAFPENGKWYDASHIVFLVKARYPKVESWGVHPALESLEKKGILESRITDESYPQTRRPVLDPFGQWRWKHPA